MANEKISDLTQVVLPLTGTEELPIVQGGVTKKITVDNLNTPPAWGDITGTLSAQTDLQTALDLKANASGRLNFVSKFTSTSSTLGESKIFDNGTNVGIGTTSPSSLLELTSATPRLTINDTSGIFGGALAFSNSGVLKWIIGAGQDGVDIDSLGIVNGSGASRLHIINSSGNVGIGTTSPSYKLDLGTSNGMRLGSLNIVDGGSQIAISSSLLRIYSASGTKLSYFNGASIVDGFVMNSAGNVGIGTLAPQSKLQVAGGIKMADDTDTASASKVGTQRYRVSGNNSYVDMCMQTGTSSYEWVNIVTYAW